MCELSLNNKQRRFVAENRAGPSNFGNVISQILLCKQITPDFNQEELCSIAKDTQEITRIVNDIQEFLPQHENLNHLGEYYMIITFFSLFIYDNQPVIHLIHEKEIRPHSTLTIVVISVEQHAILLLPLLTGGAVFCRVI